MTGTEQRVTVADLTPGQYVTRIGQTEVGGRVQSVDLLPAGTRLRGARGGAKYVRYAGALVAVRCTNGRAPVVDRSRTATVLTDA